jgi:DNA invertase Pin-like site-specific DNA recombinase
MKERGIVRIISLTQREINPYTTAGRLMITITGGIDEHEVNQITDRTKAGMAEKMLQGVRMGRPIKVNETIADKIRADFVHSSADTLAKKYRVSKSSIYKALNAQSAQ